MTSAASRNSLNLVQMDINPLLLSLGFICIKTSYLEYLIILYQKLHSSTPAPSLQTVVSVLNSPLKLIFQCQTLYLEDSLKQEQVTLEARDFTASSLGLWLSAVPGPAGGLATLRALVEELGESNGVTGRSWVGSDAAERATQMQHKHVASRVWSTLLNQSQTNLNSNEQT